MLINRLDEVEECFVYGLPNRNDVNDVKVAVEIVYNDSFIKANYENISEADLKALIWDKIKEINKTLPLYKYIKDMIITKEPLIRTTTNKTKRNEELKKVLNLKDINIK